MKPSKRLLTGESPLPLPAALPDVEAIERDSEASLDKWDMRYDSEIRQKAATAVPMRKAAGQ